MFEGCKGKSAYINDPAFRATTNNGLQRDRSALSLRNAFELEKQPVQARRGPEQPARQAQQVEQPQPVQQAQPVV